MLQTYIARFRIAKAQAALDFVEERYTEVKNELEKKQQALVQFREKQLVIVGQYFLFRF